MTRPAGPRARRTTCFQSPTFTVTALPVPVV
jgi:hypothetical protein